MFISCNLIRNAYEQWKMGRLMETSMLRDLERRTPPIGAHDYTALIDMDKNILMSCQRATLGWMVRDTCDGETYRWV